MMAAAELHGGGKPKLNEALGWIGSRVDDVYGAQVGRLEDVWIDPGTGAPRWLLVNEGRFGGRTTLIPFEDATAGAGHVWVPYERDVVSAAPAVVAGAPLTQQVEAALRTHYAANVPSSISYGAQAEPSPIGRRRETATIRFQPPSEPQPGWQGGSRYPPPPPERPQPPIAVPEPPPDWVPATQAYPQAPQPQARPPAQPAEGYAQPQPAAGWQQHARDPAQEPIDRLRQLAESGGSHYVEIELSGELTIRGELRAVRVIPRDGGYR